MRTPSSTTATSGWKLCPASRKKTHTQHSHIRILGHKRTFSALTMLKKPLSNFFDFLVIFVSVLFSRNFVSLFVTSFRRTVRKLNLISKCTTLWFSMRFFCFVVVVVFLFLIYSNCAHQSTKPNGQKNDHRQVYTEKLYENEERSKHSVASAAQLPPVAVEYTRKTKTSLHGFGAQKAVAEKRNRHILVQTLTRRERAHTLTHIDFNHNWSRSFFFTRSGFSIAMNWFGNAKRSVDRATTAVAAHSTTSILIHQNKQSERRCAKL